MSVVPGWVVRSVYDGAALIQGRIGMIEVEVGEGLAGRHEKQCRRKSGGHGLRRAGALHFAQALPSSVMLDSIGLILCFSTSFRNSSASRRLSDDDLRKLHASDDCPCGSGHSFGDCHGS